MANRIQSLPSDSSVVSNGDDGSFPLISSSSFLIATSTRYRNIPPQTITTRITPSRTADRVIVPPARQVSIPQFVALPWNPESPHLVKGFGVTIHRISTGELEIECQHEPCLRTFYGLPNCPHESAPLSA